MVALAKPRRRKRHIASRWVGFILNPVTWLIALITAGLFSNWVEGLGVVLSLKLTAVFCFLAFFVTEGWRYIRNRSRFEGGRLNPKARKVIAIISGLTAWSLVPLVGKIWFIPLASEWPRIHRSGAEGNTCVRCRVESVDRSFVSFRVSGSDETYWTIFGPFVRVGRVYNVTYLSRSKIVLSADFVEEAADPPRASN